MKVCQIVVISRKNTQWLAVWLAELTAFFMENHFTWKKDWWTNQSFRLGYLTDLLWKQSEPVTWRETTGTSVHYYKIWGFNQKLKCWDTCLHRCELDIFSIPGFFCEMMTLTNTFSKCITKCVSICMTQWTNIFQWPIFSNDQGAWKIRHG